MAKIASKISWFSSDHLPISVLVVGTIYLPSLMLPYDLLNGDASDEIMIAVPGGNVTSVA
jgi:hypothetical protein